MIIVTLFFFLHYFVTICSFHKNLFNIIWDILPIQNCLHHWTGTFFCHQKLGWACTMHTRVPWLITTTYDSNEVIHHMELNFSGDANTIMTHSKAMKSNIAQQGTVTATATATVIPILCLHTGEWKWHLQLLWPHHRWLHYLQCLWNLWSDCSASCVLISAHCQQQSHQINLLLLCHAGCWLIESGTSFCICHVLPSQHCPCSIIWQWHSSAIRGCPKIFQQYNVTCLWKCFAR